MEIPTWFGVNEYYALIYTVWFGLASWIVVNLIRVKFDIKSKILSFKQWLEKWKLKREEKKLNGV